MANTSLSETNTSPASPSRKYYVEVHYRRGPAYACDVEASSEGQAEWQAILQGRQEGFIGAIKRTVVLPRSLPTSQSVTSGKGVAIMADNNPSTDNQPDEQIEWDAQMVADVMDAPALLTKEAMYEGEATFQAEGWIRRVAATLQTKTGRELCEEVKRDRGYAIALTDWLLAVRAHIKRTEAIVEIMGNAKVRVLVALACRGDIKEILEEARQMDTSRPPGVTLQ